MNWDNRWTTQIHLDEGLRPELKLASFGSESPKQCKWKSNFNRYQQLQTGQLRDHLSWQLLSTPSKAHGAGTPRGHMMFILIFLMIMWEKSTYKEQG